MDTNEFPFKDECYEIIGACMEVANELGCGFMESVYQEALSIEFTDQGIPFEKEKQLDISNASSYKLQLFVSFCVHLWIKI